ncbi:MAG: OmpA family protein [Thiotrichales bacterium]
MPQCSGILDARVCAHHNLSLSTDLPPVTAIARDNDPRARFRACSSYRGSPSSSLLQRAARVATLALCVACAQSAMAGDRPWYVGAGVGVSKLEPDTSGTALRVTDDTDTGYKISVGKELTDRVAVEAFGGNLGSAEIAPMSSVDYQFYGVALQYALPHNNEGLSAHLKGGVVALDVDSNLPVDIDKDARAFAGIGVDYQFPEGITLRGEYEHFAKDAQLLSFNLIKKFGVERQARETVVPAARVEQRHVQEVLEDGDRDGVPDVRDKCLNTPAGASVSAYGCPIFLGTLSDIDVDARGALTSQSKATLDGIAREMRFYPDHTFFVVGHADNFGGAQASKTRSVTWAKAVAQYLSDRGVDPRNLRFGGYGDARPRASNETAEGRAMNRRVEILPASRPIEVRD